MAVFVSKTIWHGLDAFQLQNDVLSVVVVPTLGAKLVSLYDRRAQHEWLYQPVATPPMQIPYAASFHDYSMYGWDEMFPTIVTCAYPAPGQYLGVILPDHGEVWTLPWTLDRANDGELTLSVRGCALPYQLSRRLACDPSGALVMGYVVTNFGDEPMPYLWTAHPLFNCQSDTEIVLPDDVREVCNAFERDKWGSPDARYPWPIATGRDGNVYQLDRIAHPSANDARKFYVPPEVSINWAAVFNRNVGSWLRMDWQHSHTPYLGIWVDEGWITRESTVALEPATGYFDSLQLAVKNERITLLPPHTSHAWTLRVSLGATSPI